MAVPAEMLMSKVTDLAAAIAALLIAASPSGKAGIAASPAVSDMAGSREATCRLVDAAAMANRLPTGFLARILWVESRFHSDATSRAGAEGLAQFIPQTAVERGLADPREPVAAIAAAARLLADLKLRFGNLGLAAAAYNAGPGRVSRWLTRQSELPGETRLYVATVTGRPVEEWGHPAGGGTVPSDGGSCLAATTGLPGFAPAFATSPIRSAAPAPRAVPPLPVQRGYAPESLKEAETLCAGLRSQGMRCTIHQP
jgi:hypothetical protein